MNINYILATLAIIAGVSAAFTNHADRNALYPTWKFDKQRVETGKIKTISASHLADLIYKKEKDLVLVDLRDEETYREYHIPSSVQFVPGESLDPEEKAMIVLYGSREELTGEKIPGELQEEFYMLSGGIEAWYDLVLFPDFNQFQVRNRQQLEEIIAKCRYFGGNPQNTQLLNLTERSGRFREGC